MIGTLKFKTLDYKMRFLNKKKALPLPPLLLKKQRTSCPIKHSLRLPLEVKDPFANLKKLKKFKPSHYIHINI